MNFWGKIMKKTKLVSLAIATSTLLGVGVSTLAPGTLPTSSEKVEAAIPASSLKWDHTNITYSKGSITAATGAIYDKAISKINALGIIKFVPVKYGEVELGKTNKKSNDYDIFAPGGPIFHVVIHIPTSGSAALQEQYAIISLLGAVGLKDDNEPGHTMSNPFTISNNPQIDANAIAALKRLYPKKNEYVAPVKKAPVKVAPKSPTVTVNYKKGYGINLWADNNGLKFTGRRLMHGTSWKFTATNKANGHTYYKVGNNQWLDGKYLKVSGSVKENTAIVTPKTATKPTTKPTTSNKAKGVLTIKYIKGYGVNLWGTSEGTNFTGRRLKHGTSWKFSTKVTNAKGKTFYNVGSNQWVDGKYVVVK